MLVVSVVGSLDAAPADCCSLLSFLFVPRFQIPGTRFRGKGSAVAVSLAAPIFPD